MNINPLILELGEHYLCIRNGWVYEVTSIHELMMYGKWTTGPGKGDPFGCDKEVMTAGSYYISEQKNP